MFPQMFCSHDFVTIPSHSIDGDASRDASSRLSINGFFVDLRGSVKIGNLPRVVLLINVDQISCPKSFLRIANTCCAHKFMLGLAKSVDIST